MQAGNAPPPTRVIGEAGSGAGQLQYPQGVAVDGAGNVIVSEVLKNCIVIFSAEGGVVRSIGGLGSGAGQLQYPRCVGWARRCNTI